MLSEQKYDTVLLIFKTVYFTVFERTSDMLQLIPWEIVHPMQKQRQPANTDSSTGKSKNLRFRQ